MSNRKLRLFFFFFFKYSVVFFKKFVFFDCTGSSLLHMGFL